LLDLKESIFAKIKKKVLKKDIGVSSIIFQKSSKKTSYSNKNKDSITKRSSITHVYFEIHDSKKEIITKDKSGTYYLGKAVFKNKIRKKISIKQYDSILSNSDFIKFNTIIKELRNLKYILDKKKNKFNNNFLNINLIKIQTERCLSAEWVLAGPVFNKKDLNKDFLEKIDISKNINSIIDVICLLIENSFEPIDQLICEFLNTSTNTPIDLDLLYNNKNNLKSVFNKYKAITYKINYLAKKVNKDNNSISEYNKLVYEYSNIALKYLKNYKLKKLLDLYITGIRFDK
jgi:hypothetical protein